MAKEIVRKEFKQSYGTSPVTHKQSKTLQAPRKLQKVCVQFYLIIDTWINKT
jgi:hAT family C-terminal dimerisation region